MAGEDAPYLLHCTSTNVHQDLFDTLPVLLRIQLFNISLLEIKPTETVPASSRLTTTDERASVIDELTLL